jgi:hypothetical protein
MPEVVAVLGSACASLLDALVDLLQQPPPPPLASHCASDGGAGAPRDGHGSGEGMAAAGRPRATTQLTVADQPAANLHMQAGCARLAVIAEGLDEAFAVP